MEGTPPDPSEPAFAVWLNLLQSSASRCAGAGCQYKSHFPQDSSQVDNDMQKNEGCQAWGPYEKRTIFSMASVAKLVLPALGGAHDEATETNPKSR